MRNNAEEDSQATQEYDTEECREPDVGVQKKKKKHSLGSSGLFKPFQHPRRTRGDEPTGDRRDKDAAARPTSISPYTSEEEDTSDVSPEPRRRNKRRRRGS